MPILTIYRSRRSIGRDFPAGPCVITWEEFAREPAPGEHRVSAAGWTHRRSAPVPVRVRVPPGELKPADAAAVYWLAERGEDGFRLEGETVARRKTDDGPSLFGGFHEDAGPAVGAYGPAKRGGGTAPPAPDPAADRARLRPVVAELAAEVLRPVVDSIERALAQLGAALEADDLARVVTARAILENALEDAGRPAAGGTEAA